MNALSVVIRICAACLWAVPVYAQGWEWQNPLPQGNTLNDVKFVGDSLGWAVGEAGTILHTTDGGASWSFQSSGTTDDLYSVDFVDANNGWAVGHYWDTECVVLHTNNAGNTWSIQLQQSAQYWLRGVDFVDSLNGWAVGVKRFSPYGCAILHTTDGGATWAQQTAQHRFLLESVSFADPLNGWTVGWEDSRVNGIILRTSDGGVSWSVQDSSGDTEFYCVSFTNANVGWVVGSGGTIVHTTDGGANWTRQVSGTTWELHGVAGFDSLIAWAVTGYQYTGGSGLTFRTTDGGLSWMRADTVERILFWAVDAGSENGACAVGKGGYIQRTSDAGATWTSPCTGWRQVMSDVAFVNESIGWACGGSAVYSTTNSGQTWTSSIPDSSRGLYRLSFVDEVWGWALSEDRLMRTTDGGATWTLQYDWSGTYYGTAMFCLHFIDRQHGWVGGYTYNRMYPSDPNYMHTFAYYSPDGGSHWVERGRFGEPPVLDIAFSDTVHGWIVYGTCGAEKTTDGGLTWDGISPDRCNHYSIASVDSNNCWIAGAEGVSYTSDGGQTWVRQSDDGIDRISFSDLNTGWAVGGYGGIWRTTDGGTTWIPFTITRNNVSSVSAIGNQAWVAGQYGTILHLTAPEPSTTDNHFILHPSAFILSAFPNPFNPSTTLAIDLPYAARVQLAVYDIIGRRVETIAERLYQPGSHRITFDGSALPSGIYFARLQGGGFSRTTKLILLR